MTENQSSAAKRVPIRIVHSEGVAEKDSCPFLQPGEPPAAEPEGLGVARFSGLGAAGQDSGFCAFTRQREDDGEGPASSSPGGDPGGPSCLRSAQPAVPLSEERKREELAKDIVGKDRSLADILDRSGMKTTMDLMEGIFPQEEQLLEGAHQRRRALPKPAGPRPTEERSDPPLESL